MYPSAAAGSSYIIRCLLMKPQTAAFQSCGVRLEAMQSKSTWNRSVISRRMAYSRASPSHKNGRLQTRARVRKREWRHARRMFTSDAESPTCHALRTAGHWRFLSASLPLLPGPLRFYCAARRPSHSHGGGTSAADLQAAVEGLSSRIEPLSLHGKPRMLILDPFNVCLRSNSGTTGLAIRTPCKACLGCDSIVGATVDVGIGNRCA